MIRRSSHRTLTAAHPNIRLYFNDIPAEPVLAIVPNVDEWDFGLKPRFSETTKAFTIANNGAGTLTVNNVVVTGDGFALEEAFVATDLASTESVVINVVYNPDEAGDFEGLLAITSSHGSRNIDLIGSCYDPVITEFPFFEGFEVGNTQGSADIAQWEQIIGTEFPTQSWTANSTMTTYNRLPRTGDWNATLRLQRRINTCSSYPTGSGSRIYPRILGTPGCCHRRNHPRNAQ